ncbi:amidohydrolase family protein [Nostoc sp. FACHB-110]|uniref:amidohydrolase family protein n=1 Tax=Nostoc sp. FACHB-110 TaxID=2692834 RepID=UPI0016889B08|nr:amidohydrolase family protein [Nostoc sp. FACHB-110]MBD2439296.1 amidohydrolase family protein [Nostoc sp. FACHB-110]
MSESPLLDKIIKNVRLVRPHHDAVELTDVGIKDGKFAEIAPHISANQAIEVFDAKNFLGFPGVVDAHMHIGIYQPLDQDARTESKAAAMGGVTTSLNYIRTGQYYLNKGGSYRDFFPEVLSLSAGNFFVDYSYHVAPIASQHIAEIPLLYEEYGISSFKIFMFYGGYGLHGLSDKQNLFLMINKEERYDFAHFEFIMRGITRLMAQYPSAQDTISLSLHCEVAEILNAYTKIVENDISLSGLSAYSAARPPHSEGLAICIAAYLAQETNCANINLLHLSSRKAMEAALTMQIAFPHINFRKEVTVGHLLLDVDTPNGTWAKVNPPIRPRADVEYLWQAVLNHQVDWIVSDHACCSAEQKRNAEDPNNIWLAKSGFGGTEYLLSGVMSEGSKRGMSYNQMARLLSWNPSRRFGLQTKGDVAVGYDADLVLVDPDESFVVNAAESESQQGYTPFAGMELTGRVKSTFLRGNLIYHNGQVLGSPTGRYVKRN